MTDSQTINADRCRKVATAIRNNALRFDMGGFGDPCYNPMTRECGTPGCIAGFAVAVAHAEPAIQGKRPLTFGGVSVDRAAAGYLGIDEPAAEELFEPGGELCNFDFSAKIGSLRFITPEHAARCLENLADTGVVDWNGTSPV